MSHGEHTFVHEALLYAGEEEFVRGTSSFVREGLELDEPVLVVVDEAKIERLRDQLGEAPGLLFADMAEVGTNPARIIPAWQEFVERHGAPGVGLRGIGEPIWPERTADELVECQQHESLLNVAFAGGPAWHLLCPYDRERLHPDVIDEALRSHPSVSENGESRPSAAYSGLAAHAAPFDRPLPEPPPFAHELPFDAGSLPRVRRLVHEAAAEAELDAARVDDLVLAANEVTTNSIFHAGGGGMLRIWPEPDAVVCDVRDSGFIEEPLVGRCRPAPGQEGGRGLWIANQLCDLVQVRSFPTGSAVRLHMRRG